MRSLFVSILLICSSGVYGEEPVDLSFVIHGRAPLERQAPDEDMIGAAVFEGDPIMFTLAALNLPADDGHWVDHIKWKVLTEKGSEVPVAITTSPVRGDRSALPKRPEAQSRFANSKVANLPPGKYVVNLSWVGSDERVAQVTAEPRLLIVYGGDESDAVHREFLRHRAGMVLKQGTSEAYRTARGWLLEAADGNTDPALYEELADASAPWAPPDETATYYQRSLEVARRNLEKRYGTRDQWPEKAVHLYQPQERKVQAFLRIVSYYKTNFSEIRVVVVRDGLTEKFAVERRDNGKRLQLVEPGQ
jgi:hypothetical protein